MSSPKSFQKFLIDNGLIFEINRKVLHPLGLALVVDIDRDNKRKLAITGLAETDDEVGFLYDEETFIVGSEKFQRFLESRQERLDARKHKYGFIEQDIPVSES